MHREEDVCFADETINIYEILIVLNSIKKSNPVDLFL